jgi:DNA polymerase I-like protein with 3'-5' exonuclease and polymerase domains
VKESAKLVRKIMEGAFILDVPLKTEARFGLNWDELELLDD